MRTLVQTCLAQLPITLYSRISGKPPLPTLAQICLPQLLVALYSRISGSPLAQTCLPQLLITLYPRISGSPLAYTCPDLPTPAADNLVKDTIEYDAKGHVKNVVWGPNACIIACYTIFD